MSLMRMQILHIRPTSLNIWAVVWHSQYKMAVVILYKASLLSWPIHSLVSIFIQHEAVRIILHHRFTGPGESNTKASIQRRDHAGRPFRRHALPRNHNHLRKRHHGGWQRRRSRRPTFLPSRGKQRWREQRSCSRGLSYLLANLPTWL